MKVGWEGTGRRWAAGRTALPRRRGNAIPLGRRRDRATVTKLLVKGGGERKGRDKQREKKTLHVKSEEMLWELQPGAFLFFSLLLLSSPLV